MFHSEVHCYALRSLICDEPGWLEGYRRLWLERWRHVHGIGSIQGGSHEREGGSQSGVEREVARVGASPATDLREMVAAAELIVPSMHLALAVLLDRQLLQVQAHGHVLSKSSVSQCDSSQQRTAAMGRSDESRGFAESVSRDSAGAVVLAVAAAAPYDYQERLQVHHWACADLGCSHP